MLGSVVFGLGLCGVMCGRLDIDMVCVRKGEEGRMGWVG